MNEGKTNIHENKSASPYQLYQDMLDRSLESQLKRVPIIPKEQQELERLGDYGYRVKISPKEDIPASSLTQPDRWVNERRIMSTEYFFDFDDTLFDTTGYDAAIRSKLEVCGIPPDIAEGLYEKSKVVNPKTGKKMHQRELYIASIKEEFPEKAAEVDRAFADVKPLQFLNKDMAKLLRILTARANGRVHILTYGEINFQRGKVEAVLSELGAPMDILYTEVPKAEFLERYLKNEYPYIETERDNVQSFVMVDDNPEEIAKLVEFSKKQPFFVPIRLRKPSAKRYGVEQKGEKAYELSNHYAQLLVEVQSALWDARHAKKVSVEEWHEKGFVGTIQSVIDTSAESPSSQIIKIEKTKRGTLLITRKIKMYPGGDPKRELESEVIVTEVQFDAVSNTIYEISDNPNYFTFVDGKKIEGKVKYNPLIEDFLHE